LLVSQMKKQAPQLCMSESRSWQVPAQQAGVVPVQAGAEQEPQWWMSLWTSTQVPEQQAPRSKPLARQLLPQEPQLEELSLKSKQPAAQQPGVVPEQASPQLRQFDVVPSGVQAPEQQSALPEQASAQAAQLVLVPSATQMPEQHVSGVQSQTALAPLPQTSAFGQQLPATQTPAPPLQLGPVSGVHVPGLGESQPWHSSEQSTLQQTPSEQMPERHSLARSHATPSVSSGWQRLSEPQKALPRQSLSVEHVVRQADAPQT
jgi:hypothetical protein